MTSSQVALGGGISAREQHVQRPWGSRCFLGRLACEQMEQDAAGGRHRQGQTSQGLVGQAGSLDFLLRAVGSRGVNGAWRECNVNGVQRGGRNSEMRGRAMLEVGIKHLRWLWEHTRGSRAVDGTHPDAQAPCLMCGRGAGTWGSVSLIHSFILSFIQPFTRCRC